MADGVGTIRVGMIGAGWIAEEHKRVLGSVAEAELVAQIVRDDGAREGRGHARRGIEARVQRVRRHDAVHPGFDGGHEGRQVAGSHLRPVGVDDGQAQMGVDGGVALAREVLGAGGDSGRLQTADARDPVARHEGRVLAVGPDPDVREIGRAHV